MESWAVWCVNGSSDREVVFGACVPGDDAGTGRSSKIGQVRSAREVASIGAVKC